MSVRVAVFTWWARHMRSRSCRFKNLLTTSAPNVNETPRSFSPQPWTSLSGSDHKRSHRRPTKVHTTHTLSYQPFSRWTCINQLPFSSLCSAVTKQNLWQDGCPTCQLTNSIKGTESNSIQWPWQGKITRWPHPLSQTNLHAIIIQDIHPFNSFFYRTTLVSRH